MNNRRLLYYPVVIYVLLLLLVWFFSWVAGIVALATGIDTSINSLVSAEGLRWSVRCAISSINAAPWGLIMLFVISVGLLAGSGMSKSILKVLRGTAMSRNERTAWLLAFIVLAVYVVFIFLSIMSPWNILLGVTGDIYTSPLVQGGAILIFLGLLAITSIFGFINGNYRSVVDVSCSVGSAFSFYAPALLAVVPATGILSCADYTGFISTTVSPVMYSIIFYTIYFFPFLFVFFCGRRTKDRL